MSERKLLEAELLAKNEFHSGAYYLAGYAVEFALKATLCKTLGIDIFEEAGDIAAVSKSFKTHKLQHLLILSGVYVIYNIDRSKDRTLLSAWSNVSEWSEQKRYEPNCSEKDCADLITAVNYFMKWIRNHW